MNLTKLKNKNIALLGLGMENYALIKFLLNKKIDCHLTICDRRNRAALGEKFKELKKFNHVTWQLGKKFKDNLDSYDILFRSPGWPLHCSGLRQARRKNKRIIIYSPMRLFFDLCPTKNIIGVTGTKGKGTTASLIFKILKTAGKSIFLGGNIGIAPFDFFNKLTPQSWVVLELSSFQLEDLKKSPRIAVLTNFSPEHLAPADPNNPNYHQSLKAYRLAKLNIAKWQKKSDHFVVNTKFRIPRRETNANIRQATPILSKITVFRTSNSPSNLVGKHNQENIAAAEKVAGIIGIKKSITARAIKNFRGLEHRLEFVRALKGVKYYDDSFATTPESAITALKSFSAPIILLVGGADKGSDFKNLAKEIKRRVKFVCLLKGSATFKIQRALNKENFKNHKIFTSLSAALSAAKHQANPGDIILLSTGCASFGMFKNYKERGDLFKNLVKKL